MPARRLPARQRTLDTFLSSPSSEPSTSTKMSRRRAVPAPSSNVVSSDSDLDAVKPEPKAKKRLGKPKAILTDSSSESSGQEPGASRESLSNKSSSSQGSSSGPSHRTHVRISSSSDSASRATAAAPRKRRRLAKGHASPAHADEDLLGELDSDRVLEARLRGPQQSKFSQNLERLKRAKALKSLEDTVLSDDSSSQASLDISPGAVPPGGRISSSPDGSDDQSQENPDDFIVEGDENDVALPLEFSMKSHSDLAHHFKIICQLFVHLAITKPKHRDKFVKQAHRDEYFSVPLSVVRRKLRGINDSMVASSIWKPHFRARLDHHPRRAQIVMAYSVPLCDACRISGRVATVNFRLEGEHYDRDTFAEVHPEDTDSDKEAPESLIKSFSLGKFCARRARIYHSLAHWEHALFSRLQQEVWDLQDPRGSATGDFVRVNWGASEIPNDVNDPDQVMDWLDRRGVIQDEYIKIKNVMEEAQAIDAPGQTD